MDLQFVPIMLNYDSLKKTQTSHRTKITPTNSLYKSYTQSTSQLYKDKL